MLSGVSSRGVMFQERYGVLHTPYSVQKQDIWACVDTHYNVYNIEESRLITQGFAHEVPKPRNRVRSEKGGKEFVLDFRSS